ncbi:cation:proton antiporter subunit C [Dehalococcoidia bacterium]|nr:cation:proton antiporter subunit C [Dehalococcoidia bacterium]MCL0075681.1 cation:proton antiporter subunit C [Dehalococcoidia bacterium]
MRFEFIAVNFPYFVSVALLLVGLYAMIARRNLIKKIMGLNILSTSVFLFLISVAYKEGGAPPIRVPGVEIYVNPLPHALVLTGIVVALALTSFALVLAMKMHKAHGTLDSHKLMDL